MNKLGNQKMNLNNEMIKSLYMTGDSIAVIAKKMGCSEKPIFDRLHDMGVKTRGKNEAPRLRVRIEKGFLKQLYLDEKKSINEIKTITGHCFTTVQKWLRRYEIPIRTKKEAMSLLCGNKNPAWKGGTFINKDGYRMIRVGGHPRAGQNGYVFEHIIVWEKEHGRYLPKGYIIHHLNGIKTDNRPKNLIAMKRGEHIHLAEPYKAKIRELEIELVKLRKLVR